MKSPAVSRLCILMLSIFIPLASHATAITEKCPSINAIASADFYSAHISYKYPDKWAVEQVGNKYDLDTPLKWDFVILVDAKTEEDALHKAKNSLVLMKMPDAPTHVDNGFMFCEYKMPAGFIAIAAYPSGYISL